MLLSMVNNRRSEHVHVLNKACGSIPQCSSVSAMRDMDLMVHHVLNAMAPVRHVKVPRAIAAQAADLRQSRHGLPPLK